MAKREFGNWKAWHIHLKNIFSVKLAKESFEFH